MKVKVRGKHKTTKSKSRPAKQRIRVKLPPETKLATTVGYCSPSAIANYKKYQSCLSLAELKTIAALYNKNQPEASKRISTSLFNNYESLYTALENQFKDTCGTGKVDHCWIEHPILKKDTHTAEYKMVESKYRPLMPPSWLKNAREWLNTFDILKVMKQYEEYDSKFEFLGVFPVDFQAVEDGVCIVNQMCNFTVAEFLKKGRNSFGVVFNLDKHNEPGSHWVSAYANFNPASRKFGLCYYDSGGVKPPKPIYTFLRQVRKEAIKIFNKDHLKNFNFKFNNVQHQFKNTECGVFCMVFITLCLEEQHCSYRDSRLKISTDDAINKMRKKLYRPPIKV